MEYLAFAAHYRECDPQRGQFDGIACVLRPDYRLPYHHRLRLHSRLLVPGGKAVRRGESLDKHGDLSRSGIAPGLVGHTGKAVHRTKPAFGVLTGFGFVNLHLVYPPVGISVWRVRGCFGAHFAFQARVHNLLQHSSCLRCR